MNEPKDLMSMLDKVRLRPETDDAICCGQIDPSERRHLLKKQVGNIDLRQINNLDVVSSVRQFGLQPLDDIPGATFNKGNERRDQCDLHREVKALRRTLAIRRTSARVRPWCVGRLIPRCDHVSATG